MPCKAISGVLISILALRSLSDALEIKKLVNTYIELQQKYRCFPDLCHITPPETDIFFDHGCCSSCSCAEDCVWYNTCCPDYFLENPGPFENQTALYSCMFPHVAKASSDPAYWLVSKCPWSYSNNEIIRQCESPDEFVLQAKVPVQAHRSGISYRNKFCAECNLLEEDEYGYWRMQVSCEEGTPLPESQVTLLTDIEKTECELTFIPKQKNMTSVCKAFEVVTNTVNTCNASGNWDVYDAFLEEACGFYRAIYTHRQIFYNNIFCFVCNSHSRNKVLLESCTFLKEVEEGLTSFFGLFDFRPQPQNNAIASSTGGNCINGFIYDDYKETCREILCPPLTMQDGEWDTCRPAFTDISGVCYEAFIKLSVFLDSSQKQYLQENFKILYQRIANGTQFGINTDIYSTLFVPVEEDIFNASRFSFNFVVHYLFIMNNEILQQLLNLDQTLMDSEFGNMSFAFLLESDISQNSYLSSPTNDFQALTFNEYDDRCRTATVYTVGPLLQCRAIALSKSEFNWTENKNGISIDDLNWTLRDIEFEYLKDNETIKVCLSDYINVSESFLMESNTSANLLLSSDHSSAAGIVSLVCICASMVCLAVTFVIYSIFGELRTIPGKNNMALSFCLFFAQGLFQFGFNKTSIEVVCKIIGILTHAFLLMSLLWMHVCSFHMFRIFRSIRMPNTGVARSDAAYMVLYVVYTVTMAAIFVLVNVLVSLKLSGGEDLGYGGDTCYISYNYMIAFTTTIPALVIVLTNMIMFIFVVCTIHRIPEVPSATVQNRNYFSIYVKLSTITGVTYLLVIPISLAYHVVLEYAFIVLNASQGVFIMAAFVCNKQVKNKILNVVKRKKLRSSVSASTNTGRPYVVTESHELQTVD